MKRGTKLTEEEYKVLKIIDELIGSMPCAEFMNEKEHCIFHNLVHCDNQDWND